MIGIFASAFAFTFNIYLGIAVFICSLLGIKFAEQSIKLNKKDKAGGKLFILTDVYVGKGKNEDVLLGIDKKAKLKFQNESIDITEQGFYKKFLKEYLQKPDLELSDQQLQHPKYKTIIEKVRAKFNNPNLQKPQKFKVEEENEVKKAETDADIAQVEGKMKKLLPEDCTALFATQIKLIEPITFMGQERHDVSRATILTKRKFEDELSPKEICIGIDGYPISVNGVTCKFVLFDWITKDEVLFLCIFSDADAEEYLELKMDVQNMETIENKVLRRIIYHYRDIMRSGDVELDEFDEQLGAQKRKASQLGQLYSMEIRKVAAVKRERENIHGVSIYGWKLVLLGSGWAVAFLLLAFRF